MATQHQLPLARQSISPAASHILFALRDQKFFGALKVEQVLLCEPKALHSLAMAKAELVLRHRIDFGVEPLGECGGVQPTHCRRDILLTGPCSRDHRAEVDRKGRLMGGDDRGPPLFDQRFAV